MRVLEMCRLFIYFLDLKYVLFHKLFLKPTEKMGKDL